MGAARPAKNERSEVEITYIRHRRKISLPNLALPMFEFTQSQHDVSTWPTLGWLHPDGIKQRLDVESNSAVQSGEFQDDGNYENAKARSRYRTGREMA